MQPIVFKRLDALDAKIDAIDTGGGGTVVIPIGTQTTAGIVRLAQYSEVTAGQNSLAATASQVWGAENAAAIANAGVATVSTRVADLESDVAKIIEKSDIYSMRIEDHETRLLDVEDSLGDISTALAAFLRI